MGDQTQIQRVWILGGLTPDFAFDCVIRESHVQEIEVPEEPVETGVVMSDHAYLKPARLSIEAAVSDLAFHPGDPDGDDPFASSTSRSIKAFDMLEKLQATFEPFSIQTGLKLYANMELMSLAADQDAATASGLLFRAELKQITIASTQTVTYPPRKLGKPAHQGANKVNNGQQTATNPDAPKRKSVLLSITGLDSPQGQAISGGGQGLSAAIQSLLNPGASASP